MRAFSITKTPFCGLQNPLSLGVKGGFAPSMHPHKKTIDTPSLYGHSMFLIGSLYSPDAHRAVGPTKRVLKDTSHVQSVNLYRHL